MTGIFRALRPIARRPAFSIPALAGLALGIAASAAVFSVFSAMELQTMGFAHPSRLAAVWLTDPTHGQQHVELAYDDWREWQKSSATFSGVALASSVNLDFKLRASELPEHVDGTTVTGNFFEVLGAKPFAGRFFTAADDVPGGPVRVVLSHALWRTRFGSDLSVVNRDINLGDAPATVIGIARPEFDFPRDVAVWAPLRTVWPTVEKNGSLGVFRSVARLAPGISISQAQAQAEVALRQADSTRPPGAPRFGVSIRPIRDEAYGSARPAVLILMGAVLLVLIIACANAANLTLAMLSERSRELAVRSALGASRGRLIRLVLAESAALAVVAGAAGLFLAQLAVSAFPRFAPPELPGLDSIALHWPVLLFGIGLTAATVALFGAGPAYLMSSAGPNEALQGGVRAIGGPAHRRLRHLLIAAEVALCAMLVVGAGLLVRSFSNLAAVDPGFQPERVLTFRITTELGDQPSRRTLYQNVLDRVRALPGVQSAAAILIRPLSGTVGWDTVYTVEGQSGTERDANPNGNYEAVSPDYFRTMGIRLLDGRDFTRSDVEGAAGVVIINRSTALRHWPGSSAVGRKLRLSRDPKAPWLTIVGVVADVRYREWESARPDLYVPFTQRAQHRSDFVIKTQGDPWALAETVRRAVFETDKNQPISNVTTLESLVERALARARLSALLLSALAICAAFLAAVGIYGLLSYSVRQRTREIGVRTALGATPSSIMRLVSMGALGYAASGFLAGITVAASAAALLGTLLYGVEPLDPFTYAAAGASVLLVALAACAVPAWRATRIDPATSLREE